ncbi:MAG: hypothetical protein IIX86_00725 [Clostridia bacterium]|nr:hypothetical protein [Clostridia bacterium]
MKKLLILTLLSAMLLVACNAQQPPADTTQTTETESAAVTEPESTLRTVEDMTQIEGVTAVTKLDQYCTNTELAYRVDFEVDGLKRYFEIALPADYAQKDYPCVLYFPDIGYEVDYLVNNFAKKDVIVMRLFNRGSKGNEGEKDFCGKDFKDAEAMLYICTACPFLSDHCIITAGAVTGATFALKLAATYPEIIKGCAVVDVICDMQALVDFRGEQIKEMYLYYVGCTEEQLPDELAKRSPKYFYETIKAPVLLFCYTDTPVVPNEQSEELKTLLDGNGCDTELEYLSPVNSDFNGTAFMKLIPWIKNIADNRK